MLSKKYRLPIQSFLKTKGKVFKTPYFLLRIFPANFSYSRFGVVVSRKTAARATERNRLRRLAYNFLRDSRDTYSLGDYIVNLLPPAANLPKDVFLRELEKLMSRIS